MHLLLISISKVTKQLEDKKEYNTIQEYRLLQKKLEKVESCL